LILSEDRKKLNGRQGAQPQRSRRHDGRQRAALPGRSRTWLGEVP